jgi:polysaccharide pyruvyl transferase WcaK-like protein
MSKIIAAIKKINPDAAISVIGEDVYGSVIWGDTPVISEALVNEKLAEVEADIVVSRLSGLVQSHLDAAAIASGYDNIVSACSYAGAANPFQAEGAAFVAWRGAVWGSCYAIMADVVAGNRPVPTASELLAELPALVLS